MNSKSMLGKRFGALGEQTRFLSSTKTFIEGSAKD
jgi:hypothetical protein